MSDCTSRGVPVTSGTSASKPYRANSPDSFAIQGIAITSLGETNATTIFCSGGAAAGAGDAAAAGTAAAAGELAGEGAPPPLQAAASSPASSAASSGVRQGITRRAARGD